MKYYFWLVVDKLTHLTFHIPRFIRDYDIDWETLEIVKRDRWIFCPRGCSWTNYPCNRVEEEFEKREDSGNRR